MLVLNEEAYEAVIEDAVLRAEKFLWILTADLKDLHVRGPRKKYIPFVDRLAELIQRGVYVRLVHAKEPGPRFRADFDRHPELVDHELFDRVLCPRNHMKVFIIDGELAYVGSANLTGAGIGAKSPKRRNFEAGCLTREKEDIRRLMDFVDSLYLGDLCSDCGRREHCPEPRDGAAG